MMMKKRLWRIAVSSLLVLSMLLSASLLVFAESDTESESKSDGKTVDVVMLVNDIAKGARITSSDLEIKTFENVNIPENVISDINSVKGKYATTKLYAGEYVYSEQLSNSNTVMSDAQIMSRPVKESNSRFLYVTEYCPANTGKDVTGRLQSIIDNNHNRTIYFPDGEYIVTRPLVTSGAAASSVTILLSDGAVIKADPERWQPEGTLNAVICLGAQDASQPNANDVVTVGSYYSLQGGTIDCGGVAEGVSLDGGRETLVKNILIKNAHGRGIHVKRGANAASDAISGSSDAEMHYVTIICDGQPGSVGLHIDKGFDNHFSNFRIYGAQIGVKINTEGNSMKNIRSTYVPSAALDAIYSQSVGILDEAGNNFFYHCTSENYARGFTFNPLSSVMESCTARWTSDRYATQTGFAMVGQMNVCLASFRTEFCGTAPDTTFFIGGGKGQFESPIMNVGLCDHKITTAHQRGNVVPF